MHYPTLTRQQLADLRGVKAQTVSKAQLPKDHDGRYDLKNKEIRDWFMQPFKSQWEQEHKRKTKDLPDGDGSLDDEKLKADIMLKEKQGRKLDLEFEKQKKDLVSSNLVGIYAGYFASGIRINFLNIGQSIARGDVTLRDRIESMIKKAIDRTIDGAEKQFRVDAENIADKLLEKEENA